MLVNYLAELWGISIVIISLALLVKEKHAKTLFSAIATDLGMFLCGVCGLVVGVAMVLSYNAWSQGWQVIITILGWLALLKGIAQLFMPERFKIWIKKAENSPLLPYALIILIVIGLALTYFGFTA